MMMPLFRKRVGLKGVRTEVAGMLMMLMDARSKCKGRECLAEESGRKRFWLHLFIWWYIDDLVTGCMCCVGYGQGMIRY